MISLLIVKRLKYELLKSLPNYEIRVFFNYDDYPTTTL